MKRVSLIFFSSCLQLVALAQRGRLMPEDYMDYPDYSSSSNDTSSGVFAVVLLVIMAIGLIWFKISLNDSRNREIREKTPYLTNQRITAFISPSRARQEHNRFFNLEEDFVEVNGVVAIPKYAKCIILEYWAEEHSYVRVKFEHYPEPLYIGRWYLRTPDRINT